MKRILWISVAAVAIFALSLNAIAQPGGGGQRQGQQGQRQAGGQTPGQMGGQATQPQQLLRNAEVVKMLALTEVQITELGEALRPQRLGGEGAARPEPGAGRPEPGAARTPPTPEERAAQAAQRAQRTAEMWAGIDKVLTAEQRTKFREIYFQANDGMNSPQLNQWTLDALALTADQKEKVVKLVADRNAAMPARPVAGEQPARLSQEEMEARRAAMQERNTKFVVDVNAILTAEQRTKAAQLTEGAAALRTTLGIGQQGQGQRGSQQGAGAGAGGAQGGGFIPGQGAWQPGQQAPAGGGAARGTGRGAGGTGFPRGGANN